MEQGQVTMEGHREQMAVMLYEKELETEKNYSILPRRRRTQLFGTKYIQLLDLQSSGITWDKLSCSFRFFLWQTEGFSCPLPHPSWISSLTWFATWQHEHQRQGTRCPKQGLD